MITEYFNYLLFPDIRILHLGKFDEDFNILVVDSFTEYEVADFVGSELDDRGNVSKLFFELQNEPELTEYNLLVGFSERSGEPDVPIFIKELNAQFKGNAILSIKFELTKGDPKGVITFDVRENKQYNRHNHELVNLNVSKVSKFTNYLSELTNDELIFSDGYIIDRSEFTLDNLPGNLYLNPSDINDISGVYGVNFKYEILPSEAIGYIPSTEQFDITSDNITYRGNTICYSLKSRGIYKIITFGENYSSYESDVPITLINEFTMCKSNGEVFIYDYVENSGYMWVTAGITVDLILYRSAFKLNGISWKYYRVI